MSEPRHIYGAGEWIGGKWSGQYDDERVVGDRRYTLTDGEEWDALIERARASAAPMPDLSPEQMAAMSEAALDAVYSAFNAATTRLVLRDLLAYLGEQA